MKLISVIAESAGFNVPREIRKQYLDFNGIPESSFLGMLYVLMGQRPPSRYHKKSFLEIDWIHNLAKETRYQFVCKGKNRKPLPKIEEYYGRVSEFTVMKSVSLNHSLLEQGAGPEFYQALAELFGSDSYVNLFAQFEQMVVKAFQKEESEEKVYALMMLGQLKKKQDDLLNAGIKVNWCLKDGYIKKPPLMNKWWVKIPSPFAGYSLPGIQGRPLKKFVFNARFLIPIPDQHVETATRLLTTGPRCASLGEGGLAWVEAEDFEQPVFSGRVPSDYLALNTSSEPLFTPKLKEVVAK